MSFLNDVLSTIKDEKVSFLDDVLSTVQEEKSPYISSIRQDVEDNIQIIKSDIKKYMENIYLHKKTRKFENSSLFSKIDQLENEINLSITTITNDVQQDICKWTTELKSSHNDLKEAMISLQISKALVTIAQSFQDVEVYLNKNKLLDAATALKQIEDLLNNNEIPIQYLEIFDALKLKYGEQYKNLEEVIFAFWSRCIKMSENTTRDLKIIELSINTGENDNFQALVQSIAMYDIKRPITSLSTFILNKLLKPIVMNVVTLEVKQDKDHNDMLQLKIDTAHQETPPYSDVFQNIQKAFEFLDFINIPFSEDECVLSVIATSIKKNFTELLVKECLMHTVTYNNSPVDIDFEKKVKLLQESLCASGFYNEKDTAILDFAKDFDAHFANKTCEKILSDAREIMKGDLTDVMDVGTEPEVMMDCTIQELPGVSPLSFPKCKISSNVMELKELILDVLQQAGEASDMLRGRLLCTASNILRFYQQIVTINNKEHLKTIPQQTALFHNNCMYLAHWLLTISMQMKVFKISEEESRLILYSDLISSLRILGLKYFTDQMKTQRMQMLETLRESDLSSISQMTKLQSAREAIIASLAQIAKLKLAWHKILPENVFGKSIALLYNVLLEELIQRACSVEDIPASIAEELVGYFEQVYNDVLKTIKEHDEILNHVKLWQKFKELINVLKGNLQSIEHQWANGKGPIAAVFRPEELKHLIRALFKNTDRRAELLMKIK